MVVLSQINYFYKANALKFRENKMIEHRNYIKQYIFIVIDYSPEYTKQQFSGKNNEIRNHKLKPVT